MIKKNLQAGFTLIEVVVAVTVIAVGLGAVIKSVGVVGRNTSLLTERTVAMWVAQNALAEFELDLNDDATEETEGSEEMIGIEWHWTKTLEDTQDPDIQRVEFQVRKDRDDDSQVYATLVTLLPIFPETQSTANTQGNRQVQAQFTPSSSTNARFGASENSGSDDDF